MSTHHNSKRSADDLPADYGRTSVRMPKSECSGLNKNNEAVDPQIQGEEILMPSPLGAIRTAIAAGHIDAAKKMLADFRAGQTAVFEQTDLNRLLPR
jgi:hypothetical protein